MQHIWEIFVPFICLSLRENNHNMDIDIHVVDGDGLNTNTLH